MQQSRRDGGADVVRRLRNREGDYSRSLLRDDLGTEARDIFAAQRRFVEFAAELGVTPTHLTRACRATCGRPASDLLQDRRLYEARRLLSETALPVKQISAALGFTSANYFTRAFHGKTGKTPSQFRRAG